MGNLPKLVLYRQNGSCAMIPHILLRELKLPFEAIVMRMGKKGNESVDGRISHEDFLRINPVGYVPTLCVGDDNVIITEMPAILTFLASLSPDRDILLGRDALEKSRVLEWMVYLSGTLHGVGFAEFWKPYRFVERGVAQETVDAVRRNGKLVVEKCYERIEQKIEGPLNAVGNHLTVVDIELHTFWRWGAIADFDMTKYPRFRAVVREVEKLESLRSAMAEEGEPFLFESGET